MCLQEYEKKQREEERQKQLDDLESVRQAHSRYVQKVGSFLCTHEGRGIVCVCALCVCVCVCIHACVCADMCVFMWGGVFICVCVHACGWVCIHVCVVCVCMHACVCV